ncbi:winged helix-turn-helix domain-containing protein, partial [Sphingomonas sp. AOB5]|uniref:winged helix-turn-helix domain-containing protein n=1 Tax=Sphingomonas sp. AOB5 TaxID=3034017 RepID=UPI0023F9BF31
MRGMDRIDLAHEPELRLGRLAVRPALRQIARDAHDGVGGAEEVVEPRVMQVLVALAREPGAILSREDLTASCWEGRVVGEDAINRVISRLRRVAEGIDEGDFRIETITKVGYRLIPAEGAATPAPLPENELAAARDEVRKLRLDRRA